jgi:thiol-disulfide isomerase/thioredoxin
MRKKLLFTLAGAAFLASCSGGKVVVKGTFAHQNPGDTVFISSEIVAVPLQKFYAQHAILDSNRSFEITLKTDGKPFMGNIFNGILFWSSGKDTVTVNVLNTGAGYDLQYAGKDSTANQFLKGLVYNQKMYELMGKYFSNPDGRPTYSEDVLAQVDSLYSTEAETLQTLGLDDLGKKVFAHILEQTKNQIKLIYLVNLAQEDFDRLPEAQKNVLTNLDLSSDLNMYFPNYTTCVVLKTNQDKIRARENDLHTYAELKEMLKGEKIPAKLQDRFFTYLAAMNVFSFPYARPDQKDTYKANVESIIKDLKDKEAKKVLETLWTDTQKQMNQNQEPLEIQQDQNSQEPTEIEGQGFNFNSEDSQGNLVSLSSFRGKVVYIDFWATWCAPCLAEIPALKKLQATYEGKDVVFVSASIDSEKDKSKWKKMVQDKQLSGVQVFIGIEAPILSEYKINSIPKFFVIDKAGNVINTNAPRPSQTADIQKLINSLL